MRSDTHFRFDRHFELRDRHAALSPSKYSWLNYSDEKLVEWYFNQQQAAKGTELHELGKKLIELKIKLPANTQTLNAYVNDAIGFDMVPEQPLFYSRNIFGTADAISFRERRGKRPILRIHDLKTGVSPASPKQLEIYAALFCLEYKILPVDIDIELRIYQNDAREDFFPEPHDITRIMSTITMHDRRIEELREEGLA